MWYVYIIRCSKDDSLYTGITNNLEKRIATHNAKNGAKYTRSRAPVKLLRFWKVDTKSLALKVEYYIKQLKREDKLNFKLEDYMEVKIIGMTKQEAIALLDSIKADYRVVKEEGKGKILNQDLNKRRYNLEILEGKVINYTRG